MEGPVILLIRFNFVGRPHKEEEFNHFYSEVHVPNVAREPGVLGAYRYQAVDGRPREYVTIYAFENEEARSKAMRRASDAISEEEHDEWQRWRSGYLTEFTYNTFREIYNSTGRNDRVEGPILMLLRYRFLGDREELAAFNEWYSNSHIKTVERLPGCNGTHRYASTEDQAREFLTFYALESVEARSAIGRHDTQELIEEHKKWHYWRSQHVSGFANNLFQEIKHIGA